MTENATRDTATQDTAAPIRLGMFVLDTPDPRGLAAFYAGLLGWELDPEDSDDDWVTIRGRDGTPLAFQLSTDHVAPTWPQGAVPQQTHLDLFVDAYDGSEERVLALGGRLLEGSDEHGGFRVYADPAGHPFCLCLHPGRP